MPEDNSKQPQYTPETSPSQDWQPNQSVDDSSSQEEAVAVEQAEREPAPTFGNDENVSTPTDSGPATDSQAPQTAAPAFEIQKKKSRKKPIILAAVAVVLLGLIGGAVYAYNWYQNPDKVVFDSVVNAIAAKSAQFDGNVVWKYEDVTLTFKSKFEADDKKGSSNATLTVDVEDKKSDYAALDGVSLSGETVYQDRTTVYFKLSNLKEAFDKASSSFTDQQVKAYEDAGYELSAEEKAEMESMVDETYGSVVKKLDGQWIKLTSEGDSSTSKAQKCLNDAMSTFEEKSVQQEVYKIYKDNTFIDVKDELGTKDGSTGYSIGFDHKAANAFMKEFKKTSVGKALDKCEYSPVSENSDFEEVKGDMELWVTTWDHQMSRFVADLAPVKESKLTADVSMLFNKPVKVSIPKDAKSFEEVFKDDELFGGMNSGAEETSRNASI